MNAPKSEPFSYKHWETSYSAEPSNLLLRECTKILENGEFSDTEILVGKAPNAQIFHLHSFILKVCSPYFRKALLSNRVKIENNVNNIIKLQILNISVNVFDIIVKYIYSGKLNITNNFKTNIGILIAANELCLDDLCSCMEVYLLKNKRSLIHNFVLVQKTVKKFKKFKKLLLFYNITYQQDPSLILKANDFTTIKQEILLDVLTKSNHSLQPIEIWDKLVEWVVAQSNELSSDVTKWTAANLSTFGTLIQQFIPHINFKEITPFDFFQKIKPFESIFDNRFYIKILEYYSFNNIHTDSKIINVDLLARKIRFVESKLDNLAEDNTNYLYKLKLLVRGSTDGFDYKTFHKYCDNRGSTITIAKVKNTNKIVGGYNSYDWNSEKNYVRIKSDFVFFLDENDFKNFSCRKVNNCSAILGPEFGSDLKLLCFNTNKGRYLTRNQVNQSQEVEFEIEEYEVFQVCKKFN